LHEARGNGSGLRGPTAPVSAMHDALGGSPLDPRLTFDSFVVGRSNTLAHAAAKQVAQARRGDTVMFNPLYIHAGVGLGKTHLLQSLAWAGNGTTERKALYLTAERFMYGFVAALRAQNALAFRTRCDRRLDDRRPASSGQVDAGQFCPRSTRWSMRAGGW
jgi:chromosomal replication initiation ATPase DnaA